MFRTLTPEDSAPTKTASADDISFEERPSMPKIIFSPSRIAKGSTFLKYCSLYLSLSLSLAIFLSASSSPHRAGRVFPPSAIPPPPPPGVASTLSSLWQQQGNEMEHQWRPPRRRGGSAVASVEVPSVTEASWWQRWRASRWR